ncbi:hypothetical protein cyc_03731 [Cyclospora cayetanensis]|uniref:Uncharacterized protein n=1 Tax=Cyclospora cayetanensis TaxID=88456 RepID=A0A1D3D9V0_9EIME|nr:hypothetical protein cyc_03731 [Cyclospora cayetanensis]
MPDGESIRRRMTHDQLPSESGKAFVTDYRVFLITKQLMGHTTSCAPRRHTTPKPELAVLPKWSKSFVRNREVLRSVSVSMKAEKTGIRPMPDICQIDGPKFCVCNEENSSSVRPHRVPHTPLLPLIKIRDTSELSPPNASGNNVEQHVRGKGTDNEVE